MSFKRFYCEVVALAACLAGLAQTSWAQAPPLASGQAIVTYEIGSLRIKARDVPLVDVLHAVSRETGARLDIPGDANERVEADLGPGPAREVLTSLLKGQGLNYTISGSSDDPRALQVSILPRSHAADAAPTATTPVTASSGSATPIMQHQTRSPRVVPDEHKQQMKQLLAQARDDLAEFPGAGDGGELDAAMAAKFLNQVEADFGAVSEGGTPASQPAGTGVPTGNADRDGNPNPVGGHPSHRPH